MAFLRDEGSGEPAFRVPAAVAALIVLLAIAHIARVLLPPEASERILLQYGFMPLRYSVSNVGILDRVVPFVSYIFLHGDLTHLAMNCLWLLAFGPIVARRFGPFIFLLFVLVCGVIAAGTHLAFNWGSPMPIIGASGSIAGLMGAAIRLLRVPVRNWEVQPGLAPIFSRPVMVFSLLWIAINLAFGLTGLTIGGETSPLAWQAHLGGYFAGLLLVGPFDWLSGNNALSEPA